MRFSSKISFNLPAVRRTAIPCLPIALALLLAACAPDWSSWEVHRTLTVEPLTDNLRGPVTLTL